jgi:WD40 repeat protein
MSEGDQISAGNISGEGIAIGRDARVDIRKIYGDIIVRVDSLEDIPPVAGPPPYKGLAYFTEKDAHLFFGREALSEKIIQRLQNEQFLAILGASGSGKTSLLRAGVVPRIRRQNWLVRIITPTADPLLQLANALIPEDAALNAAGEMEEAMLQSRESLQLAAKRAVIHGDAEHMLLIVDQFEELFTLCHDEGRQIAFLENLLHAAQQEGVLTIIIGLRADMYDRALHFSGLRDLLAERQIPVGPMERGELLRIIAEPAKVGGWGFVEGLVEQILDDVGSEPGRLPLLSHALIETWEGRRGTVMTLSGYRAAGGVEGAIAQTAEEMFKQFSNEQVLTAAAIVLSLTELGEGTEITRRVASREEIARIPGSEAVLELMVKARLVTMDSQQVQVAHEALLRRWPRLQDWLQDNQDRLRLERRLAREAMEWAEDLNRDTGALYRGARLAQALEWADEGMLSLSPLSEAFLQASREEAEREQRMQDAQRRREEEMRQRELDHQRQLAEAQKRRAEDAEEAAERQRELTKIAEEARHLAESQQRRAEARELAYRSAGALDRNFQSGLLYAYQALKHTYAEDRTITGEAHAALYNALTAPGRPLALLVGHEGEVKSIAFDSEGRHLVTGSADGTAKIWDARGNLLADLEGLQGAIYSAVFAADGESIATAGRDGTARIWDLNGGHLATLQGHGNRVMSAVFSPDGEEVLTASWDSTARLWTKKGRTKVTFRGHKKPLTSAIFDRSGSRILTTSHDHTARLWKKDGTLLATLTGHEAAVNSAAFSVDGETIVTASQDGTARLWDAQGNPLASLRGHTAAVWSAEFSPDGDKIITGGLDGTARLWNAAASHAGEAVGELLAVLVGHTGQVWSAVFSPTGESIATVSSDGTARLWDSSGLPLLILEGHTGAVLSIAYRPDGKQLATAGSDGTGRIWDSVGEGTVTLTGHRGSVNSAAFNADGTRIVTASDDQTARLWDMPGVLAATLRGHSGRLRTASFNPPGDRILTASDDHTARLWDRQGVEIAVLEGHTAPVITAFFSRDGSLILTAGDDRTARLWDTQGRMHEILRHVEYLTSAAISGDNKRVITVGVGNQAQLWDIAGLWAEIRPDLGAELGAGEAREIATLRHKAYITSAVFSPDSRYLLTTSKDGTARLWDADGNLLAVLEGHTERVNTGIFDAEGTRILTAADDYTARIWDLEGRPLAMLEGHTSPIKAIAIDSAGGRIVTGSAGGTARVWDVEGQWLVTLEGHAGAINSVALDRSGSYILTAGQDGTARIWRSYPNVEALLAAAEEALRSLMSAEAFEGVR